MIKNLRFLTLALLSIVFNVAMADPGYMEVKFVGTEDAIEVINDAEGNAVGFKLEKDGFTIKALKADGASVPTQNGRSLDYRTYALNTLTVSGQGVEIMELSFLLSEQGKKRYCPIEANSGTWAQSESDETFNWYRDPEYPVNSVTFTVGEKAEFGTDGGEKAGQFDFDEVTIYFNPTGVEEPEPVVDFITDQFERYELLTDPSTLKSGDQLVILSKSYVAMATTRDGGNYGAAGSDPTELTGSEIADNRYDNYFNATPLVSFDNGQKQALYRNMYTNRITLEEGQNGWYFKCLSMNYRNHDGGYLYQLDDKTGGMRTITSPTATAEIMILSNEDGTFSLTFAAHPEVSIVYDNEAVCFTSFNNNDQLDENVETGVYLYRRVAPTDYIVVPQNPSFYATLFYSDKNLVVPNGMMAFGVGYSEESEKDEVTGETKLARVGCSDLGGEAQLRVVAASFLGNPNAMSYEPKPLGGSAFFTGCYLPGEVIPAGTAVVTGIESTRNEFYPWEFTSEQTPVDAYFAVMDEAYEDVYGTDDTNLLNGFDEDALTVADEPCNFYRLTYRAGDSHPTFRFGAEHGAAFTSAAHKAYLAVPKSLSQGANSFSFDLFGTTDGINQAKVAEVNAQGVYTLSGVRVDAQKLQKGIYIVNGKKMVIK